MYDLFSIRDTNFVSTVDWPDFFAKDFGGSDIIYYYSLLNTHKSKSGKAFFETHNFGVRATGRDRSTVVVWDELKQVMDTIVAVGGDRKKYLELPSVIYPEGVWEGQSKATRHTFTKTPPANYYQKISQP